MEGFFAPKLFDTELILNNYKNYWQCHRAIGKAWGLKPIYTSVIRPMFTYAAFVWWKRTHLATVKISLVISSMYEYHTYGSNGDPPGYTTYATCG
jgi:hypothetical protein